MHCFDSMEGSDSKGGIYMKCREGHMIGSPVISGRNTQGAGALVRLPL